MSKIKFIPLNEAQNQQRKNYWGELYSLYNKTSPGNCVLPVLYEKFAEKIRNFGIRKDDIFIMAWMKTGSTWTQELVWSLINYENIEVARKISLDQRAPYFEVDMIIEGSKPGRKDDDLFLTKYEAIKSPRIFKTHLPLCLLPPNLLDACKVVTCLRNPKDTLVSLYHYSNLWHQGSFEEFFELFMDDLTIYSPFWDAVLDQWKNKDHANMCLLFYEDMKRDLAGSIRKVAEFLNKDISDSVIDDLVERLSFKKLKADEQEKSKEGGVTEIYRVYRKGEIGDWKNHFTKEMNERMDKLIDEKFKDTGLKFTYE